MSEIGSREEVIYMASKKLDPDPLARPGHRFEDYFSKEEEGNTSE